MNKGSGNRIKQIPRKLLDDYIAASRSFWEWDSCSESERKKRLSAKMETSFALGEAIGVRWLYVQNLVDGIVAPKGFAPNAENEAIYSVLRVLGWNIVK